MRNWVRTGILPATLFVCAGWLGGVQLFSLFRDSYGIAAGRDADGNPIAWRVNQRTGQVNICTFQEFKDPDNPFGKMDREDGHRQLDIWCRSYVGGLLPRKPPR